MRTTRKNKATRQWLMDSKDALSRVRAAEHRFSAAIHINQVALAAAADELHAATKDVSGWLASSPCPSRKLAVEIEWVLDLCMDTALSVRRVLAEPEIDMATAMYRIWKTVAFVEGHSALNDW
jgi:hypothetical protein